MCCACVAEEGGGGEDAPRIVSMDRILRFADTLLLRQQPGRTDGQKATAIPGIKTPTLFGQRGGGGGRGGHGV